MFYFIFSATTSHLLTVDAEHSVCAESVCVGVGGVGGGENSYILYTVVACFVHTESMNK